MMHWPEEQGAATAAGVIHQTITPQKATHIPTLHQASSVIATDALREVRKRRSISRRVIRARPQGKAAEPVRAMSSITWCRWNGGGGDAPENMQWQTKEAAKAKDKVE